MVASLSDLAIRHGQRSLGAIVLGRAGLDLYPEPDRFVPDRWLHATPSPYAYLPFGAGPRMCIDAVE